jgi:competence protein ComEC
MLFYYGSISLIFGLAAGLKFSLSISYWILIISILFSLKILLGDKLLKNILIISVIFLISFYYGSFYKFLHQPNSYLKSQNNNKIELRGVVIDEPVRKEKSTHVVVKTEYGKVLLFANSYPTLKYGDEISFKGRIRIPKSFKTENGKVFNYPEYLSKDHIHFTMTYPSITKIKQKQGNFIKQNLFDFKYNLTTSMEKVIPNPEVALLKGITVAGKSALPQKIIDEWRRAGVSHVVVLSGFHVTVVVIFIMSILKFLPRNLSFVFGLFGILSFCIMAGATSTIVRASIMASLFLLSKYLYRTADANRMLFIAAALMSIQNPLIIFYDISFHLSFLATFAIINFSNFVKNKLSFLSGTGLDEIIAATICAEIFLMPYLIYTMGKFSVVGLFTNILILVYIPLTMILGFITSALSLISIKVSILPAFISFIILRYELGLTHFMASLPFAEIKTAVPMIVPAVFYILAFGAFIIRQRALILSANLDSQKKRQHISSSQMADSPTYMNAPTYLVPK